MKNNTAAKTEIPQIETELNIKIQTGYFHDDEITEARQQIDKTSALIESLFNLVKTSALNYEGLTSGEISPAFAQRHFADIAHVCEIGAALAASICDSATPFLELETMIEFNNAENGNGEPEN